MIFGMSYLEIAANLMTVLCIVLAGRNNIHTWWTGIVACILFGVVFFDAKLYADVTLQAFFIGTSIIGWKAWAAKRSKINTAPEFGELPITRVDRSLLYKYGAIGLLVGIVYGTILYKFTNAYLPFVDSAVMVLSVVGQLMLMQRKLENWPTWILVNAISVPLYWSKDLKLTAFLYACFLINAIVSWRHWKTLWEDQTNYTPTPVPAS